MYILTGIIANFVKEHALTGLGELPVKLYEIVLH